MSIRRISRRKFLKLAAMAGLLAGCNPSAPPQSVVAPVTSVPAPVSPIPTFFPTPTTINTGRPQVIKIYPEVKSRVVRAQHAGIWHGDALDGEAIGKLLDVSIVQLTGIDDPTNAWLSLFALTERVAIKVNAISNGSTHVALVLAVAQRLQSLGIPPDHITIYDRMSQELADSGFPVNRSGNEVRCYGNDGQFTAGWQIKEWPARLSAVLAESDALINIPVLKAFTLGGLSFAMKNHYGSVESPDRFHDANFSPGITGLNALEPIRRRTRLIIGDILSQETHKDWTSYAVVGGVNAILTSFDPVALDYTGLEIAKQTLAPLGLNMDSVDGLATEWLQAGAEMGLGTNDPTKMDLLTVNLT